MLNGKQAFSGHIYSPPSESWIATVKTGLYWAVFVWVVFPSVALALLLMFVSGFSFDGLAALYVRTLDHAQQNPASQRGYLNMEECVTLDALFKPVLDTPSTDEITPEFNPTSGQGTRTGLPVLPPVQPCIEWTEREVSLNWLASEWGKNLRQFYWLAVVIGALSGPLPIFMLYCIQQWKIRRQIAYWGHWDG